MKTQSPIHNHSELTETERRRMREMREDGFAIWEIAERYDVPAALVAKVVEGVKEQ